MTKAAKRKPKTKPVAKAAKPKTKPRAKRKPRKKPMTTDKDNADKAAATKKAADEQAKKAADEQKDALAARDRRDHDPADKRVDHSHRQNQIDNRDQDPNHPANKTAAYNPDAPTTFSIPPEDMLTEQEKDVVGTGGTDATAGVGPVSPAEHTSGPVETIEDQGIGPRTPYPTGNPPPDSETITRSQGVKDPDAPRVKAKPGETTVKKEHV